jgi:alkylation response protein AidB-like acyl-CoA dehydrogenase
VEHRKLPDLLANLRYKSATGTNSYDLESAETSLGTGFNSLQASVTAAKTNDPVVFFGNLSYTRSLPAHHTIPSTDPSNPDITSYVGYLRPGDAFGFQLGSILALNTETSMTFGWDQRFTQETKLNGVRLPASYLVEGSLRIGTSYMFAPGKTIDLSFGVGLTPDTPNLQFSVGFPFRRVLWRPARRLN